MFKITNGRCKESCVWDYFDNDRLTQKSKYHLCKASLSWKNPTNLKTNKSHFHKEKYKKNEKRNMENRKPAVAISPSQLLTKKHIASDDQHLFANAKVKWSRLASQKIPLNLTL